MIINMNVSSALCAWGCQFTFVSASMMIYCFRIDITSVIKWYKPKLSLQVPDNAEYDSREKVRLFAFQECFDWDTPQETVSALFYFTHTRIIYIAVSIMWSVKIINEFGNHCGGCYKEKPIKFNEARNIDKQTGAHIMLQLINTYTYTSFNND